ncbi:MAG: sugar phosphate isomerase/epimerase family protein [Planctomycetota bacterium]
MTAAVRAALHAASWLLLAACAAPPRAEPAYRFGVAAFDQVDPLAAAGDLQAPGFDYLEPALSRLAALPAEELAAARERVQAGGIPVETMNWFLPGTAIKVTGPTVDDAVVRAYVERALGIAASFGARVIVFGSPGARSFPDGFPRDRAWQQLVAFLRTCASVIAANHYELVIGIEALRRQETNLVNRFGEALALAREVDRPQVRVICDFYHLCCENEDPDVVRAAGDLLVHVQVADPVARRFPVAGDAERDGRYAAFVQALRAIGYRGRISIEAVSGDVRGDAAQSLAFLRAVTAR